MKKVVDSELHFDVIDLDEDIGDVKDKNFKETRVLSPKSISSCPLNLRDEDLEDEEF